MIKRLSEKLNENGANLYAFDYGKESEKFSEFVAIDGMTLKIDFELAEIITERAVGLLRVKSETKILTAYNESTGAMEFTKSHVEDLFLTKEELYKNIGICEMTEFGLIDTASQVVYIFNMKYLELLKSVLSFASNSKDFTFLIK